MSNDYDVEKGDEDDEMYDEMDDNLLNGISNQESKNFDTEKE